MEPRIRQTTGSEGQVKQSDTQSLRALAKQSPVTFHLARNSVFWLIKGL